MQLEVKVVALIDAAAKAKRAMIFEREHRPLGLSGQRP